MKRLVELAYFTDDVGGMSRFYRQLLGVEPVAQSEDMAIFMVDGTKVFIHAAYTPGEGDLPPEDHTAFEVDDLDGACEALTAAGLKLEVPPQDFYWGRSAYLRDPDGHQIELIEAEA